MNAERPQPSCDETRSRRLLLKSLAVLGFVLFTPAILCSSGCATVNEEPNGDNPLETMDDVLLGDRP